MSDPPSRSTRRSNEQYVDAAMSLLDASGPAVVNLGFSTAAAAAITGMARSAVYRRWETIEQLNDDMAYFKACHRMGWQRRILALSPDDPLDESLTAAIGGVADRDSIGVRGVVTAWPAKHPSRARVADWETAWFEAFSQWLDAHVRSFGRRWNDGASHRLAAVALTALIDGWCLEQIFLLGFEHVEWGRPGPAVLIGRAAALVESLTASGSSVDGEADAPPTGRWSLDESPDPVDESISESADRLGVSFADISYVPWLPEPSRLVDLGQLSRRLGVTERRLYAVWPTAGDMNSELGRRVLDRAFDRFAEVAARAIEIGDSDDYATFEQLLSSMFAAMAVPAEARGEVSVFALSLPLTHPLVRAEAVAAFEQWRPALRSVLLAMLALTGTYRRRGVSADDYHDTVVAAIIGSQRLVDLHPALSTETVSYRGDAHSLMGMALLWIGASLTTKDRPGRAAEISAPPIGPDGT